MVVGRKEEEGRGRKYGQENYEASRGWERYQAWIRELRGIRGKGEVSSLDKRTKRHQGGSERLDVFTYKRTERHKGDGTGGKCSQRN